MKNKITIWSYEKPTQEGLYLACLGDVETSLSVTPIRLVDSCPECYTAFGWNTHTIDEVSSWSNSFKFALISFI